MSESSLESEDQPRRTTTVPISYAAREKLRELRSRLGFTTYSALFTHLSNKINDLSSLHPLPSYERLMFGFKNGKLEEDPAPRVLVGESGVGKTKFLQTEVLPRILNETPYSVLIFDSLDHEWPDEKRVAGFTAISEVGTFQEKLKSNERFFLAIETNKLSSKPYLDFLIQSIDLNQDNPELRARQKELILIVEDAHDFEKSEFLPGFARAARKRLRKLILVTTNPNFMNHELTVLEFPSKLEMEMIEKENDTTAH